MSITAQRDLGGQMRFRITDPTSGGWFCFDLVVSVGDVERRYEDIEDDFHWYGRAWHRIARPFRKRKMRERAAWWLVCIVPQFVARWLMFSDLGQRVPIPAGWVPYLFGRALGRQGQRAK